MASPATLLSGEDPMNWSVEEVVQFLCTPTKPQWAIVDPPKDLNALETCLKSNEISGNILLNFVNHEVLREDLKISCFRDRLFVSSGIKFLKENSPISRSQENQKESTPQNGTETPAGPPVTTSFEKLSPKAPRRVQPIPATRGSPSHLPFLQESDDATEKENESAMERGSLESTPESIEGVDPTELASLPPELQRLLRHHPPNFTGSVTSNSSSDSELEYESELEHAPDTRKPSSSGPRLLLASDVDSEINTYVEDQRVRFQENVLPRHLHQALDYWNERGDRKLARELARNKCHLQKRLESLRGAIHREKHTSRASVIQQCANLGQTILDLCLVEWKQMIMSGSTCPDNISTERGSTLSRKPTVELEGEVILPSDEDDAEYQDKRLATKRLHSPEERGPLQFVDTDDEDIDHFKLDEEMEASSSQHDSKRRRTPKTTSCLPHDACEPAPNPEKPLLPTELAGVSHKDGVPVDVFDKVGRLTWSEVERSGNRECLLAKALMELPPPQFEKFSDYLGEFMIYIYEKEVQEALVAMAQDEVKMEGNGSTYTYMSMTLASLFVSWVKRVKICAEGIELEHVNAASKALQVKLDGGETHGQTSEFGRFWTMLDSLVTSYGKRRHLSEPTMPSGESKIQSKNNLRGANRTCARLETPLTSVQQEAQARQSAQEGAKLALEISTTFQETGGSDPFKKPVTFKEPRIYLDSNLSRAMKDHQLHGVQFMFREVTLTDPPEGCLLAHTMGLGKTMQVIALLLTIAAAGASEKPEIRDQIPSELRESRTLILCPAFLILNWSREFQKWLPPTHHLGGIDMIGVTRNESLAERFTRIQKWNRDGGVLLVGYEMLRRILENKGGRTLDQQQHSLVEEWLLKGPNLVVADEAHTLRNNDSPSTQFFFPHVPRRPFFLNHSFCPQETRVGCSGDTGVTLIFLSVVTALAHGMA